MSEIKRIQGMVRSMDQWCSMVPVAVATGSMAQVEYALADAKTDIEALWAENDRLKRERNFWQSQHDERTRQLGTSDTEAKKTAQEVTDEMVEAVSREYMRIFGKHLLSKHARLILIAAQEGK